MAAQSRKWLDNAFWHDDTKTIAEAILCICDDSGREITQCLTIREISSDGDPNPDFLELIESVGVEKITANTKERLERKEREREQDVTRKKAEGQAKDLERLFDAKIKMLAIEEIANTENKSLKKKLRRSKNMVELNMYAQLIMMEENGIGFTTYDTEQTD